MQEMRWLIIAALLCSVVSGAFAESAADSVCIVTWNMKWFPSGKADLRISAEFEDYKIRRAAEVLTNAVMSVGGGATDAIVICAQEVRDRFACEDLVEHVALPGMRAVEVSEFCDRSGIPIWQQCAILSNIPVLEAGSVPWQSESNVDMPRGFTYAVLGNVDGLIAVFCVHLKSNLNLSGTELEAQKNIYKREFASAQILEKLRLMRVKYGERLTRIVVAGDFNTNEDDDAFVSEATLRSFYGAHFRNCFRGWRKHQRVTHPASSGYPDATFDYILCRGFGEILSRKIISGESISDHNPVGVRLMLSE